MTFKKNDRIELVHTDDEHTELRPGDRGTVAMVDSLGTVHVNWDSGSTLGIVAEAGDRIRKIGEVIVAPPMGGIYPD